MIHQSDRGAATCRITERGSSHINTGESCHTLNCLLCWKTLWAELKIAGCERVFGGEDEVVWGPRDCIMCLPGGRCSR